MSLNTINAPKMKTTSKMSLTITSKTPYMKISLKMTVTEYSLKYEGVLKNEENLKNKDKF